MSTTKAIVFSALKYQDSSLIVSCLTKEYGLKSYLLKGVLKAKKSKIKPALFQPLSLIEITSNHRDNISLNYMKEAGVYYHFKTAQTNIYKNAIIQFIAEILSIVVKEEEENTVLYNYIEEALVWLDKSDDFSNFHLLFLLNLSKYLGCYPEVSNSHYDYFDLESGCFEEIKTKTCVSGREISTLKSLLGIDFDALKEVKLNANSRQEFISMILAYFNLHLFDFKKPKSLDVLSKIFS